MYLVIIFLIILVIILILQISNYVFFNSFSDPKNLKSFKSNDASINDYLDKSYDEIKSLPKDDDFGFYYDEHSNSSLFHVQGTHDVGCFRKHILGSPCEFDFKISGLKDKKNKKINLLDAGCGVGGMSFYLVEHMPNIKVTSLTNSLSQYKIIQKEIKQKKLEDRMKILLMNFDELTSNFDENTFDYIIFLESHGYSNNQKQLFEQIYKILKPNGTLYIKTPIMKNTENSYLRKLQHDIIKCWRYNFSSKDMILTDLEKCQFKMIEYNTLSFYVMPFAINFIDIFKEALFILLNLKPGLQTIYKNLVVTLCNMEEMVLKAQKT
jgi:SAM-dependent methyltransferase